VVLVLNDWLLKGAGIFPGWLTGKLSDLAGMVVAPVVIASLLSLARVPTSVARTLAVGFVAAVFVAIKVDASAARRFDVVVNGAVSCLSLPLAARTVSDRTDLGVVPVLAVGGWVAGRLARDPLLHRSGALFAGLLACAATSPSQMRLDPHWAFAGQDQGRRWGDRLTNGAIVVQFGRQSSDGALEIGVELAARDGDLALDARGLALNLPGERVLAQVPEGQPATVQVPRGETASLRYFFRPRATGWRKGTPGTMELAIIDRDGPRTLRVNLSFDERIVPWHEHPALR